MIEGSTQLPLDERVRLARKDIRYACPFLKRTASESAEKAIVGILNRYGLNNPEGHNSIVASYESEIKKLEQQLGKK